MNNLNDPIYYLINNYLNETLSEEESRQIENMFKENTAFREEVFFCKLTNELVVEERYFQIAGSIRNSSPIPAPQNTSWIKNIPGFTSACIVLLATICFIKTANQEKPVTLTTDTKSNVNLTNSQEYASQYITSPAEAQTNSFVPSKTTRETIRKKPVKENKNVTDITSENSPELNDDSSYSIEIFVDTSPGLVDNMIYSFKPSKGEVWKIPDKGKEYTSVKIFNNKGKEVFQTGYLNEWNGVSNDGDTLKTDIYTYILDFGSGEIEHGKIKIMD